MSSFIGGTISTNIVTWIEFNRAEFFVRQIQRLHWPWCFGRTSAVYSIANPEVTMDESEQEIYYDENLNMMAEKDSYHENESKVVENLKTQGQSAVNWLHTKIIRSEWVAQLWSMNTTYSSQQRAWSFGNIRTSRCSTLTVNRLS